MKKYQFLNVMRLIMAIVVVMNHLHPFDGLISNEYLINEYNFLLQTAVPFFLLTTGFFIGKKIKDFDNITEDEMRNVAKTRNKIFKLYIIFTIIYLPITIYYFYDNNYSILGSLLVFIRNVLFIGENFNSWILWYLLSEIYALTFILILFRLNNKSNKSFIIYGIFLYIFGILINLLYSMNFSGYYTNLLIKILHFFIPKGRIFYPFIFIPLGVYISKNEKITYFIMDFIIFILILVLNSIYNNEVITKTSLLLFSVINFKLVLNVKYENIKFSEFCKMFSEKLYFWHLFIWSVLAYVEDGYIDSNYGFKYFIQVIILILIILFFEIYFKKIRKSQDIKC